MNGLQVGKGLNIPFQLEKFYVHIRILWDLSGRTGDLEGFLAQISCKCVSKYFSDMLLVNGNESFILLEFQDAQREGENLP